MNAESLRPKIPQGESGKDADPHRDAMLPPEPTLQVSYVIPIRGEVTNGNFFKQLRDFTNQRRIPKENFEVVYLRNNPPNDAEKEARYEQENAQVLASIEYIQGSREELPDELEPWQEKIIKRAKENRLRVQTRHVSVDGEYNGSHRDNILIIHKIGENVAVNRFRKIKVNGAVVIVDADYRIGAESTHNIVTQLLDDPEAGMLRIPILLHPMPGEGGKELVKTSPMEQFSNAARVLEITVRGRQSGGWYAIKSESLGIQRPYDEDLTSHRDILRPSEGIVKPSHDIKFYTKDRALPTGEGGEFSLRRQGQLHEIKKIKLQHPALTTLVDVYERYPASVHIRSVAAGIFQEQFGTKPWAADIIKKVQAGEAIRGAMIWIAEDTPDVSARDYVTLMEGIMRKLVGEDNVATFERTVAQERRIQELWHLKRMNAIENIVEKAYKQSDDQSLSANDILPSPQSEDAHILKLNPWMIDEVNQLRKTTPDKKTGLLKLRSDYPEYLSQYEQTEFIQGTAILHGINTYLERHALAA